MARISRVSSFIHTLGVNTRLEYTDGSYANSSNVIADLGYLGISNVREGTPNPLGGIPYQNYISSLNAAAAAGITFDFVVGPGQSIGTSLGQMDNIAVAYPGSVIGVEGPNEINNWPITYKGLSGEAAAISFQRDLYAAVNADTNLASAQVYYYTGGTQATTLTGLADAANIHPYLNWGQQPGARFQSEMSNLFALPGGFNKVITETGYFNGAVSTAPGGVDAATQAKGSLNLFMDGFSQGYAETYIYQLLAAYPDPNQTDINAEYGLFNLDNTPRPAAVAIHNLTTILADDGANAANFTLTQPKYSVSGLPSLGNVALLEKSDGTYDYVVWSETSFWNSTTGTPIKVPPTQVTITLNAGHQNVDIYDPMIGTAPIASYVDAGHAWLNVTDHPLIAEVTPATVNGMAPTAGPSFLYGSGGGHLKVFLSANGTAQAKVSVDGNQVFSGQNVTALLSAGMTESFLVTGPFGHGHDIAVSVSGGGAAGSVLEGATVNGILVSGAVHTFAGSEVTHFTT